MLSAEHKRAMELAQKDLHSNLLAERRIAVANSALDRYTGQGGRGGKMLSVAVNNGEFKAAEQDGDVSVAVVGKVDGKKVNVSNVAISEPGVKLSYDKLENVPEKYRERVNKLIGSVEGSSSSGGRGSSEAR